MFSTEVRDEKNNLVPITIPEGGLGFNFSGPNSFSMKPGEQDVQIYDLAFSYKFSHPEANTLSFSSSGWMDGWWAIEDPSNT